MRNKCKCGDLLVNPVGDPKAKILLVGDWPTWEDIRTGRCLSDPADDWKMTPTKLLSTELLRFRINLRDCRYTNLWQHNKKEKECPLDVHLDIMMKEFKGREYVLLMGTDVCKAVVGESSTDASGLKFKLSMFPKTVIIAAPNPATVISGNIGEFRLALQRLKKEMK